MYFSQIYFSLKLNPTTAKIQHTNLKVDHRFREVNISTSNGHNFFKKGPVGKRTSVLDSLCPIVKYMYHVLHVFFTLSPPKDCPKFKNTL